MKTFVITAALATVLSSGMLVAQEVPQASAPTKEHEWLQKFVGEWELESEATAAPGQPPLKCTGSESVHAIGGLWIVSHMTAQIEEFPMSGVLTLGYDPERQKYVGTWIDSVMNHLWTYEGTLDAGGTVLTLEAEGPIPGQPGTVAKFRDVHEFKSPDHRVATSSMLQENGEWMTFMTAHARRKK